MRATARVAIDELMNGGSRPVARGDGNGRDGTRESGSRMRAPGPP